jgi:DNA mismatch repair protein MutS2
MNKKALQVLEYHRIIEKLTGYAVTTLGQQLCENLSPMTDITAIEEALRQTTDAATYMRRRGRLPLDGVKDIGGAIKRLSVGSSLGVSELYQVSRLLGNAAKVKAYGRREVGTVQPQESQNPTKEQVDITDSLAEMFESLEPLTQLKVEIQRCIASDTEVNNSATLNLSRIRQTMSGINGRMHAQLNRILNSNRSYLQDGVVTMRGGSYCLAVKAEYKNKIAGVVHDQSATGSTYFIEPMAVIQLKSEYKELEIQEQKEIETILANLSNQVAEFTDEILVNLNTLAQLDFIFAKAKLSQEYKGTCPIFNTKGYLHIKDGRHPLLDPEKVVPTTIYLGDEFDLLIITGPNTGGKTVSLKTTGILTLMGQSGLHIPAFEGSELAVFREVFTDIGDEQSIDQNLSTFSSHMRNIIPILAQANRDCLVLFDELGAGTDPVEGAALAMSILSFLHNLQVRTMATTHYSELKIFALSTEGVENASCEFDVDTLSPTYRLLIGVPGKSNAFAISEKLGLAKHIIETAQSLIGKQEQDFEDVITELETTRKTLEKEKEEVERYRLEAEELKNRLSEKQAKIDESREKILTKANEEARQILQEAKDTADKTIRQINKIGTTAGVTRQLEEERGKLRKSLEKADKRKSVVKTPHKVHKAEEFKIGDAVRVVSLGVKGTVTTLPNAKGELYVQMGIMRSQVNIKDLELLQENTITGAGSDSIVTSRKGRQDKSSVSKIKMSKSYNISPEVNLIGMTTDEAIAVLDKYLDDAYLAHLPQVRVVHGRGTGALRNAVHNYLKKLNYVHNYRLGTFGEGNTGVTIVEFQAKSQDDA